MLDISENALAIFMDEALYANMDETVQIYEVVQTETDLHEIIESLNLIGDMQASVLYGVEFERVKEGVLDSINNVRVRSAYHPEITAKNHLGWGDYMLYIHGVENVQVTDTVSVFTCSMVRTEDFEL